MTSSAFGRWKYLRESVGTNLQELISQRFSRWLRFVVLSNRRMAVAPAPIGGVDRADAGFPASHDG
jgi:hypothetical protein